MENPEDLKKLLVPTRTEVYLVDQDKDLNLGAPASVEFLNISQIAGRNVVINGSITLGPIRSVIDGSGTFPATHRPQVNNFELDLTPYTVRFNPKNSGGVLQVIVKYYTNQ